MGLFSTTVKYILYIASEYKNRQIVFSFSQNILSMLFNGMTIEDEQIHTDKIVTNSFSLYWIVLFIHSTLKHQ